MPNTGLTATDASTLPIHSSGCEETWWSAYRCCRQPRTDLNWARSRVCARSCSLWLSPEWLQIQGTPVSLHPPSHNPEHRCNAATLPGTSVSSTAHGNNKNLVYTPPTVWCFMRYLFNIAKTIPGIVTFVLPWSQGLKIIIKLKH